MNIKEHIFDTGTVKINYAEIPSSGVPLVLLHGGNARWQAFGSILEDLVDWHVYAPDFRGHGKSGWVPSCYRLQDYMDDIISLLRKQIQVPALLFGHSLGGIIALMVAAQYTEGVRAVVVGDAPLSRQSWWEALQPTLERLAAWRELCGGQQSISQIVNILRDSPVEGPGKSEPVPMRQLMGEESPFYDWMATSLYQGDPDMLTAILERFDVTSQGYEMKLILPAIRSPVLLLQADPKAGGVMNDEEIEIAWPLLARPSHVRLDGVSHVLHNENKEPVIAALKSFFYTVRDNG